MKCTGRWVLPVLVVCTLAVSCQVRAEARQSAPEPLSGSLLPCGGLPEGPLVLLPVRPPRPLPAFEHGTWLWQGFRHRWEDAPHRFRNLFSGYYDIVYDFNRGGTSKLSGTLREEQRVGACDDTLHFTTYKKGFKTSAVDFRYGEVSVEISGDVDERVERTLTKQVSLQGLERFATVTLIMRGFRIEEYNEDEEGDHAYPTRGFGIWVTGIERQGDELKFDLHVMAHPAPKPENLHPTPDPWRFRYALCYTLVGGTSERFAFTQGSKSFRGETVSNNEGDPDHASAEKRQTVIEGEGDNAYNHGVVAFRGFCININHEDEGLSGANKTYRGRLVREIKVNIEGQSYEAESGEATFTPDLYFSNESDAQYAMNTSFQSYFTLLQIKDGERWNATATLKDAGEGAEERELDTEDDYCYSGPLKSVQFSSP